jgi:hypothetical protein
MSSPTDAEPDDNLDSSEKDWELAVGQGGPNAHMFAKFIPMECWQDALTRADGSFGDGFVILQAPSGDYVQALAQPKGFVIEYRRWWRTEVSPGFRHYQAYRPSDDGLPPPDDDPEDRWAMPLKTTIACFKCFSEYPCTWPETTDLGWGNITSKLLSE